ncbi:MAG TPA: M23 family metallopeptidase [Blastocatellia bacterium]|nr:M23 family metallopeptidase [Blastocatellia bacterium]
MLKRGCEGRGVAIFGLVFLLSVTAYAQTTSTTSTKEQTDRTDVQDQSVIIPPAPPIVKKNPNSIAVPQQQPDQDQTRSYQEKVVADSHIRVGSMFGYRRDPFTRRSKFHAGLDIHAGWGDPIGASLAGVITFAGWSHGYGNMITVDHGGGVTTNYAHLSSFAGEVGQQVERGDVIGYAGSTGRATSPHLHYEVRIDGSPVNPLEPLALDSSSEFFKRLGDTKNPAKPSVQMEAGKESLTTTVPEASKPVVDPGKPANPDPGKTVPANSSEPPPASERPRRATTGSVPDSRQ